MAALTQILPAVYLFEGTCNVYVVKHQNRAVLVDCGSGAVVDRLPEIGVDAIDWVLFTHHHRDQCSGAGRLVSAGANFYVIRADNGKALFIEYPYASQPLLLQAFHSGEPFFSLRFVEHHLDELREDWGIEHIDVVIPTHVHDDHVCGIPFLQRRHGTQCWALEDVAKVIEAPEKWSTPCLFEEPVRIDRRLRDGETFEWEGFPFEIVHYPGQTEFHCAVLVQVDGRRAMFTGDSTYPLSRYQPERKGEWMVNTVLRNSLTLAMHRKCVDEFERLRPDLLCTGHGPHYDVPPEAPPAHRGRGGERQAARSHSRSRVYHSAIGTEPVRPERRAPRQPHSIPKIPRRTEGEPCLMTARPQH